jgi:hypothetical protein
LDRSGTRLAFGRDGSESSSGTRARRVEQLLAELGEQLAEESNDTICLVR